MGRWAPDARGRLQEAALALYAERGFENTTVAEIAERAGVTERTFFRHFADKREVLFGGADTFQARFIAPVAAAPDSLAPIDAAAAGLEAAAALLEERREFARRRRAVIAASPELRERELTKLASLATGMADTLRDRGVEDSTARLTAEIAIAVFRTAFECWLDDPGQEPFPEVIRRSLDELKALTSVERAPTSP